MGRIVAVGEPDRLAGLALAGVEVVAAGTPAEVLAVWADMQGEAGLLLLTPTSARALVGEPDTGRPLRAVIPE